MKSTSSPAIHRRVSPSNFALTNPEVFRATVSSGDEPGQGPNNLSYDIERGNFKLRTR